MFIFLQTTEENLVQPEAKGFMGNVIYFVENIYLTMTLIFQTLRSCFANTSHDPKRSESKNSVSHPKLQTVVDSFKGFWVKASGQVTTVNAVL